MSATYAYTPDYAVSPGETLREMLEMKSMSQSDLATRSGLTEKTISQIVNGVAPITYETAEKLELVLGTPSAFWNRRESLYREALLRASEAKELESEHAWLASIPCKELVARGFLPADVDKGYLVREALKFFQVSSVDAWKTVWLAPQVQFRGGAAQVAHPGLVAAWIRMGERLAEGVQCAPYDESRFRKALDEIRELVRRPISESLRRTIEIAAAAGVAVVLVKEIPRAGVSGATKWANKDKALILLSLKYKSDDQFWFSFFHESCHVLKHGKKSVFFECGKSSVDPREEEANLFAREILIPPKFVSRLGALRSQKSIREFAQEIGISPGVVVGRLQHDKLVSPAHFNDLKIKYAWGEPSGKK